MIWQLEYLFARSMWIEQHEMKSHKPVFDAKLDLYRVIGLYLVTLIGLFYRLTHIDPTAWFAQYWPHLADGKLFRASDGLIIVLSVGVFIWLARRFNKPERYGPILQRFGFDRLSREEFFRDRWFNIGMGLNGILTVAFTMLHLDLLLALTVLYIAWGNWRIYQRYYRN